MAEFIDKPGGLRLIRSFVPLSEMFSYISNLRGEPASYRIPASRCLRVRLRAECRLLCRYDQGACTVQHAAGEVRACAHCNPRRRSWQASSRLHSLVQISCRDSQFCSLCRIIL